MGLLTFLSYFIDSKTDESELTKKNTKDLNYYASLENDDLRKEEKSQHQKNNSKRIASKKMALKEYRECFKSVNLVIKQASNLIDKNLPLAPLRKFDNLNWSEELYTPTGKDKKVPYTLTFILDDNQTGTISFFRDLTIAGIRVTSWDNKKGYTIKTTNDGKLTVKTIDDISSGKRLYDLNPKPKKKVVRRDTGTPDKLSEIDLMQRESASEDYIKTICQNFYSGYSVQPFISLDREKNTKWIEQASMFGVSPSKENMTPFKDGYLAGHIYMLHWLTKFNPNLKRIPVYFEYEYGIDFMKELNFLKEQGLIDDSTHVTKDGLALIKKHKEVIKNHH